MPFFPPLRGTLDNTLSGMDLIPEDPSPYATSGMAQMPQTNSLTNILTGSQASTDMFRQQQATQTEEPPQVVTRFDPITGKSQTDVSNLSGQALSQIMQALQIYPKVLAGMQGEVDRLQMQEQRVRQNPLLNVLSTVAGNLAVSDPRLPPLVSALGRSSLQLNPTPDQLANQRMALLEQQGRTTALAGNLGLGLAQIGEQAEQRQLQREMMIKEKQDSFLSHETDKANDQKFDARGFVAAAMRMGFDKDEAIAHAQNLLVAQETARIRKLAAAGEEEKQRANVRLAEKQAEIPLDVEKTRQTNAITSASTLVRETEMEGVRSASALAREKEMAAVRQDYRKEIMTMATQNKKDLAQTNLGETDKAQIQAVDRLGSQVQRVQSILAQHPEYVNPLQGNVVVGKFAKMSDSERQFLYSIFRDMTATVVQMSGEKTRGFTRYGLEFNKELVPKPTDTLSEIAGKLKQLQMERKQRFEGIKKVYPKADIEAFNPEGARDDRLKVLSQIVNQPD